MDPHVSAPAGPVLVDYLKALPQYLYPHHPLSRMMHAATRCCCPRLKNPFTRWFVRRFGIDLSEAAQPDPLAYPHFNAFFTRALREGARPLAGGEAVVVSPVDGTVSQLGAIRGGDIFQAKGRRFDLTTLLGGDPARAAPFRDGAFATIYLSPRDYHRIHMPLAGRLTGMVHVPGRLFSVNPATTRVIPGLFARNERVVALFDTAAGPMAVVMVGAIFVGSIETVWAGEVTPPAGSRVSAWGYPADEAPRLVRGEELGRFNMGSTVILLFGRDRLEWDERLAAGGGLRMGQALGSIELPAAR
ncbi:archaetidylserine decarboxylase [Endothiovibrio diazotrophicus]